MSRECPHPLCRRTTGNTCFACRRHWFALPLSLRFKINDAFTDWSAKRITLDQLRAIQNEGLTWFLENPTATAPNNPKPTPRKFPRKVTKA